MEPPHSLSADTGGESSKKRGLLSYLLMYACMNIREGVSFLHSSHHIKLRIILCTYIGVN